jgi:hypothetical protein
VLRPVVTIAHEAGHALVALLVGRRLTGIRLHSDSSGLTVTHGQARGAGLVATGAAGYPAPSVVGLAWAWTISADLVTAMLWSAVAMVVAMLLKIRNPFGVLSLVGTGLAAGALARWGTPEWQLTFAATMTWLMLIGGLRSVAESWRSRRRNSPGQGDADLLASLTVLPAGVWSAGFLLCSLAGALAGGYLMLRP